MQRSLHLYHCSHLSSRHMANILPPTSGNLLLENRRQGARLCSSFQMTFSSFVDLPNKRIRKKEDSWPRMSRFETAWSISKTYGEHSHKCQTTLYPLSD